MATQLFLNRDNKGEIIKVLLGKSATTALFDYLWPRLQEINPEKADQFAGEYWGNVLSLISWPTHQFMEVYQLIIQACDEVDILQEHKDDLKHALESDKRYQAV